ncbi:hypothetical protein NP493_1443g00061 [Ridgeia piscesae]|uniref:Uncharacterized protein n=1 Tax=Ridgeia piscesae TaxID=27915 RepID=A0AAD9K2H4_RIDPI|nr:hypothetical protein NP493_1443g00061 [Ridgeia piscesae]
MEMGFSCQEVSQQLKEKCLGETGSVPDIDRNASKTPKHQLGIVRHLWVLLANVPGQWRGLRMDQSSHLWILLTLPSVTDVLQQQMQLMQAQMSSTQEVVMGMAASSQSVPLAPPEATSPPLPAG